MSIIRLLTFVVLSSVIIGCGQGKNKVKPIINFTPKLYQEVDNLKVSLPVPSKANFWPGINFVNELNNNFEITNPSFVFRKSNMSVPGRIVAAPVIANNKLFVLSSNNTVACYDIETQKQEWKVNLNTNQGQSIIFAGGLTIDGNRLYVVNNSRDLIVLEASSGYEISRLNLSDIAISPVTVAASNVYLLTANNQISSFDKKSLANLWQINGLQNSLNLSIQSFTQPIVLGETILTEFYSGQLAAISKANGQPIWQLAFNEDLDDANDMSYSNLSSQSVVDGNAAFVSSSAGFLTKVDVLSGQTFWRKKIQDILSMNKFGNLIILTTNAQEIAAVSSETGEVAWVIDLTLQEKKYNKPYNLLTPFMVNDSIYVVSSNGKLYEISSEGSLVSTRKIPSNIKFYAVNQDNIYLFSQGGIFYSQKSKVSNAR